MDLHDIAKDHLVTTAQARDLGLGPADLRAMVRLGLLHRVIRGWYAVRPPDGIVAPWEDPNPFAAERARHLLVLRALLRSFEGRVAASHHSTLVLHDVELWRSDLRLAHLARTVDDHSRHRTHAVIHPHCGVDPVLAPTGELTVPVEVAVVQVGLRPFVGGRPFPMESLVAADNALFKGLITHDELQGAIALHEGHPGIVGVRRLLEFADERHETVGETRTMHNLRLLGYEIEPQREVTVRGRTYRVDGKLKGWPLYVEFDGRTKYLKPGPVTEADAAKARQVLDFEKDRQGDLMSGGATFVRFRWNHLDSLQTMDRMMKAGIEEIRALRAS